jgi:protein-tyrosine phosphatase
MIRAGLAALLAIAAVAGTPSPAATQAVAAPDRVLPLQGGRNFRDLGGYATADGHHVRWRVLFRSGAMDGLTPADYAYLDKLGIRFVCDFRTKEERDRAPTVWQGEPRPAYWTSDAAVHTSGDPKNPMTEAMRTSPEAVRAAMIGLYRHIPEDHAEGYRAMFRALAAGQVPLAFNCTAGKDRSGVAAALILAVLGVPRATIVEDYAYTDKVLDYHALLGSPSLGPVARLPADMQMAVLRADPAYIEAALDALDTQYGGADGYVRTVLGLSDADIAHIRARLLQ